MRGLIIFLLCLGCATTATAQVAQVQVTGLTDFTLGNWSLGDPAINAHIDVCTYAVLNSPGDGYAVKVSSDNGSFALKSGSNAIPYNLTWEDSGAGNLGSNSGNALSYNVKKTGQRNASVLSALCTLGVTGPTARLNLKITQAALTAAPYGTYSDTLNITISPN